ncbi:MAG: signal peptidase I [Actinomycetota bacterium]
MDLVFGSVLALLTTALIGMGAFILVGGKALIVRSGSMEPAVAVGDVIVTRAVRPTQIRVGDVITFSDPTRSGELVTHRTRSITEQGSRIAFVTQGDANGGAERWTIHRTGTVGLLLFRVPKVGYAVSWAAEPRNSSPARSRRRRPPRLRGDPADLVGLGRPNG